MFICTETENLWTNEIYTGQRINKFNDYFAQKKQDVDTSVYTNNEYGILHLKAAKLLHLLRKLRNYGASKEDLKFLCSLLCYNGYN